MSDAQMLTGHVLDVLATLPAESVNCVVTSPPYWSLRKYDAPDVVWGGDESCAHEWAEAKTSAEGYHSPKRWQHGDPAGIENMQRQLRADGDLAPMNYGHGTCARCGAWRGQYGLEPTPELYVEHTIAVLRAIRRVLRKDGVVFLNLGDSYTSGNRSEYVGSGPAGLTNRAEGGKRPRTPSGLKPKDLVLMPERVALAAQADGWWVRSRIIWHKPNAMPESVRDRPTDDAEHIWMLTKSKTYWWDQEAVREPHSPDGRMATTAPIGNGSHESYQGADGHERWPHSGRNLRTVWSFPTAQTPEAHFATFPIALPLRCIAAACPREVCATCGTARARIVDVERPDDYDPSASAADPKFQEAMGHRQSANSRPIEKIFSDTFNSKRSTVGWTSCPCAEPDYQPGTVLDPFAGLATTGLAALRLGRRFVGVELSEKYAEMARRKLQRWWEDTRLVEAEVPGGQAVLL